MSNTFSRRGWLALAAGATAGLAADPANGATANGAGSPAALAAGHGGGDAAAGHGTAAPAPDLGPIRGAGASDNALGARLYNIRDFGAKGDGTSLDTKALQAAIDACTRDLGGTVLVPAGRFVIGTVELKSNVTLHLAAQATLVGSADGTQYRAAEAIPLSGDTTLNDGNVGLIFAVGADNITIEGKGTIDGQGAQFRSPARGLPSPAGRTGNDRPYHLLFHKCNNLTVRDIYLYKCAYHSIRVIQSEHIKMGGLRIYSKVIHNNDGFHFISCRYVHLSNCDVQCQDDACALFGSCQYITVTNCSFSTRWSVFRFGGGEARNITVSNCLIYEAYGCPIKMRGGQGSRFEDIRFSDIVMRDVTGPISIGLQGEGVVRNISFSGIHATVVKPVQLREAEFTSGYRPGEVFSCMVLNGVGEAYLENISFEDVHVHYPGGGTEEQAAVRAVPAIAREYFEIGVPPAYGLYVRNVKGLTLSNIRLTVDNPELRPALIMDHVTDAAVNGLSAQGDENVESLIRIIDSSDVLLTATRVLSKVPVFLRLEGPACANIKVDGGDQTKATKLTAFEAGALVQPVQQ
ncbi:glycoside hydrolase family 28 protein [Dinghuibacter silviterrae]|uniref:Glycosyl hydrolase family 28 n=1 Tax=Dinghuibacter silviterrae TaxID=1539049 RepID=A0A4R8DUI5_9BACT|nr:glycosyl hydrolase family 28 protein [Dinghuibacter silviterrae]TDX02040.1 glycosyl hydrolase family 28 [Dinghuibacter silviterrae]